MLLADAEPADFPRSAFAFSFLGFFFFFSVLEYLFRIFAGGRAAAFLVLLPAALLYVLLREAETRTFAGAALLSAVLSRELFIFLPGREKMLLIGSFVLDSAALYLRFGEQVLIGRFLTDRLLFIGLAVLTLAALQKLLCGRGGEAFPFFFFALAGLIIVLVPMGKKPIDWTPVLEAGEDLVDRVKEAADSASYYFGSCFEGDSYGAGYSSLNVTGGRIAGSGKTELILRMEEESFYVYRDGETGKSMRIRRTVYLAGGRGVDGAQLARFLNFLHKCGADRACAALFSRVSNIDVEYAYLATADEIAPTGSILLHAGNEKIEGGVGSSVHRKGYALKARYLDMDYGSPYLMELFRGNEKLAGGADLSYEAAAKYFSKLYGFDFRSVMGPEEYEAALGRELPGEYRDTEGASGRMRGLAEAIAGEADNAYDACRRIEAYLRQYSYSKNAVGGHDPQSDMSTAEGMADIADRFLFETQSGYCVHYTSAMVMLLRLSGIPARAAAGYRYAFPFEKEEAYEVDSGLAHVWPEAYLAEAGWVPFEPSAAYRTAAEFSWGRTAGTSEAAPDAAGISDVELPELPEAEAAAENEAEDGGVRDTAARVFRIVGPVLLGTLLLLAALACGSSFFIKMRYRRGTPEKKLLMDVGMIRRSIRRQAPEKFFDRGLLTDYAERAPSELQKDLVRVFHVYYRIVYGGGRASPEENELARELRVKLSKRR